MPVTTTPLDCCALKNYAHLAHTYITCITSTTTTTTTHIHFTLTNFTVSCCYHPHCCVLHKLLHYHLHFLSMTVLHFLHFYHAFPTKVTMKPLNSAMASDIFFGGNLKQNKKFKQMNI